MIERLAQNLVGILRENADVWFLPHVLFRRLSNDPKVLLEQQHGTAKGKHREFGGPRYGPITRISQILAAEPDVEVGYLVSDRLWIGEIEISGNPTAIFRWRRHVDDPSTT